jgi:transposase
MGTTFSKEFKAQIVELHRQGRTFVDLGREFNLSPTSVANWVREADKADQNQARAAMGGGESAKAKIARLERELARKEQELEILGKALAFFARQVDQ